MSYNSKYTGKQVENLLSKVEEGNIDIIKLTLSIEDLINCINTKSTVTLGKDFIDAIKSGNRVLIPKNSENPTGYYTINGHIDSYGKLSIALIIYDGKVIYGNSLTINTDDYSIDGSELYLVDLKNKQETLVNKVNIKSINGDSILGSGNLIVKHNVVETPLTSGNKISVQGGNVYNITTDISYLYIFIQNNPNHKDYEEISILFTTGNSVSSDSIRIVTQTGIPLKWANGINPLNFLMPNTSYELSIAIIKVGNTIRYNGILVPFYT
jgi:hypothetical protein